MENVRYGLALSFLMLLAPLLLYWPLVHGCIRFWRRLGVATSLVILWGGMGLLSWGVYLARALLANYLATYLLFFCWFFGVLALVRLEERELVTRFGKDYERYQREVPRFLPQWG